LRSNGSGFDSRDRSGPYQVVTWTQTAYRVQTGKLPSWYVTKTHQGQLSLLWLQG